MPPPLVLLGSLSLIVNIHPYPDRHLTFHLSFRNQITHENKHHFKHIIYRMIRSTFTMPILLLFLLHTFIFSMRIDIVKLLKTICANIHTIFGWSSTTKSSDLSSRCAWAVNLDNSMSDVVNKVWSFPWPGNWISCIYLDIWFIVCIVYTKLCENKLINKYHFDVHVHQQSRLRVLVMDIVFRKFMWTCLSVYIICYDKRLWLTYIHIKYLQMFPCLSLGVS